MAVPELWRVAAPDAVVGPGTGYVALSAPMSPGGASVWFHEAMAGEPGRAGRVEIWLPGYRGKSFVPLLGWLAATRLAAAEAEVTWWLEKRQGPDSVARMLT